MEYEFVWLFLLILGAPLEDFCLCACYHVGVWCSIFLFLFVGKCAVGYHSSVVVFCLLEKVILFCCGVGGHNMLVWESPCRCRGGLQHGGEEGIAALFLFGRSLLCVEVGNGDVTPRAAAATAAAGTSRCQRR